MSDSKPTASVSPYHTCPVAFWSLSTYKARITINMSKLSAATHSARPTGTNWPWSHTSSTWTTDDKQRASGLSQQQQMSVSASADHSHETRGASMEWPRGRFFTLALSHQSSSLFSFSPLLYFLALVWLPVLDTKLAVICQFSSTR